MESLAKTVALIFLFCWTISFTIQFIIFKFLLDSYFSEFNGLYYFLWIPLLMGSSALSVLIFLKILSWLNN